jgi:hypothetical protein
MKTNKYIWHGVDASNIISLFEYGFLMRLKSNSQYEVCSIIGYDELRKPLFAFDTWDANEARENLRNDEKMLKGLAEMCGYDTEEYITETSLTDVSLLSDLISFHGTINEFGGYYAKNYTEKEIRKRLNKALIY